MSIMKQATSNHADRLGKTKMQNNIEDYTDEDLREAIKSPYTSQEKKDACLAEQQRRKNNGC